MESKAIHICIFVEVFFVCQGIYIVMNLGFSRSDVFFVGVFLCL